MAQKVRPAVVVSVPYEDADRALIAVYPTQRRFVGRGLKWLCRSDSLSRVPFWSKALFRFLLHSWSGAWECSPRKNWRMLRPACGSGSDFERILRRKSGAVLHKTGRPWVSQGAFLAICPVFTAQKERRTWRSAAFENHARTHRPTSGRCECSGRSPAVPSVPAAAS